MNLAESLKYYDKIEAKASKISIETLRLAKRELVLNDRFYLGTRVCNRHDMEKEWIYDRCREVEADPDGYLDLWAREHYKSTIITFLGIIQEICKDREITIGIFSFNRSIAKSFLRMIMKELENNTLLKWLFPEIFWTDPKKNSRKYGFSWSAQDGIVVKRKTRPNENTVEAWGLIDGQPTSKHFVLRIYNDVVTDKTSSTPGMREKVTEGWKLSQNLGRSNNDSSGRMWHEGTIYHMYDTYNYIAKSGEVKVRKYPATDDGTIFGKPVLMSKAVLASKLKLMGSYVFAAQMLLDPLQHNKQGFKIEWIRRWPAIEYKNLNIIILVDPASKKGKRNDFSTFWVIGLGPDKNYYVIDLIRDKLTLTERGRLLFRLVQIYNPVFTGYEEAAMQTDREHYEYVMNQNNYRFQITPLHESQNKQARILSLVPIFEAGRIFFPETKMHINYEMKNIDMIEAFINEEYSIFPFVDHDDGLDCLAKINHKDLYVPFPEGAIEGLYGFDKVDYNDEEDWDPYEI